MKKYFGIILIGLSAGLISCISDDDSETVAPTGGGGNPAFESTVRFERDGETVTYDALGTFTEEYVEEFELNVFSFDIVESVNLSESKFLIGMSIYDSSPIFENMTAETNFPFYDSWVISGQEGNLGLGVTWRDDDGNSTLYTDVVEGDLYITSLTSTRVRGLFSFKIVAPSTGDTLSARTSIMIARPL